LGCGPFLVFKTGVMFLLSPFFENKQLTHRTLMRCYVQVIAEFRKNERFGNQSIIKLEDGLTLSPYFAVSQNLSEAGMYFKSLFEFYPGARIRIRFEDYTLGHPVAAKVVWCNKLKGEATFGYGVGVEFLQLEKNVGAKIVASRASLPTTPSEKTAYQEQGGGDQNEETLSMICKEGL
jgi:Tfp pilus assembly protein PilZ